MVRREAGHSGFVTNQLRPPFHLIWAAEFEGERIGTAMEPIVSAGKVFVGTHAGNVYALDELTGTGLWRFQASAAFLHSPAVAEGIVVAASANGHLYGINAATGKEVWYASSIGGFSAAPIIVEGTVYIGSRGGEFLAVSLKDGKVEWRVNLSAPIRQTAGHHQGRVFVTTEDLRVHCLEAGTKLWTSDQLVGQTARDYYPIVVEQAGRLFVIVRSNPILNMGQRIGRDRTMLCRNAGVDDSGWQKVDAWIKSDAARGTAELWEKEQRAIVDHLGTNRTARTFFVLDGKTGRETQLAPVLWIAGCQAVGAQPALTSDGRLLVFYRSAYGNWNHGVAPLVALGLLDLSKNRITPLFHQQGRQPRWNCFWGTADESQNFVVAGNTVIIVHQGNLSGFDLEQNQLFAIAGERDTYGGFANPPWARNEWHGPARSGVAVVGDRIYWQTGSRILSVKGGSPRNETPKIVPRTIKGTDLVTYPATNAKPANAQAIKERLVASVEEVLSRRWAPLFTDPGLSGRDFSFDDSGDVFESLSLAYPHLPAELQRKVKSFLEREWNDHPPFRSEGRYSLSEGESREWFWLPPEYRSRLGKDPQPHPFGNVGFVWLYAERCSELKRVLGNWPQLKNSFEDFSKSGWRLDPAKGDLFANRYLSSLLAVARIADKAADTETGNAARGKANETAQALIQWWKRAAAAGTLRTFKGASQLDPFIGKGDGLSFAVAPHRHKIALFQDLTPEVAQLLRSKVPEVIETVWQTFEQLYCTWPLMGEERQVHFGENFIDPPDLAFGAFKATAWLTKTDAEKLVRSVDVPFCKADLYYVAKLAIALDRQ